MQHQTNGNHSGENRETSLERWIRIFILQCAACLALGFAIWGVCVSEAPWAQETREAVSETLHSDEDWGELPGLSFAGSFWPHVQAVFAPASAEDFLMIAPVTGEMAAAGDILAFSAPGQAVLAAADGDVFYAGEDCVYVLHKDGYQTRYRGLLPEVKSGVRIAAGESIGTVREGCVLTLELLRDGKSLPAEDYLPQDD